MARIDFKLPDIGEGVAEGEITSWKVKAGDTVTEDQVMVEVMTDKATVEIGSPVDGSVVELRHGEGDTVPVGEVIVVLSDEAATGGGAGGSSGAPRSKARDEPKPKAAGQRPQPQARPAGTAAASGAAASSDPGGDDGEEIDFALPDIGEGVAEGEITKWLVQEGEQVTEDQPMLEVMTDKATVEIGSPVDGSVLQILHQAGDTVPVGEVLLVLTTGAPAAPEAEPAAKPATQARPAARESAPAASKARARQPASVGAAPAPSARASTVALADTGLPSRADGTRRVRAAPAVRRLAREMGVEIAGLDGSGPQGRVTMDDVRSAQGAPPAPRVAATAGPSAAPAAAPSRSAPSAPRRPAAAPAPVPAPPPAELAGDERVPLRGLRKRIAAQMRLSKQTAAHFAYVEELDVTELVKLRQEGKQRVAEQGVKLTYMPFIIKAVCIGLREFPLLNASLDEEAGELVYHHAINLGVAVDTPAGLIVPVVRNADTKSLLEIGREIAELADRARAGKTRPEDVGGGTFTITNAGNIGGLLATPIINVPEVAIVGVHAIRRRPWVVDEQIVIRDILYLSLSLDHRVVDGAVGAYFMNRVKELLESPARMLLEG